MTFRATTEFEAQHPTALAIYCSDGRFTRSVEELLESLGHERLDTMTMPGGPALLHVHASLYSDADATTRAASFLIRGHHIRHAILLAHEGCGYYRARYASESAAEILRRQLADLEAVAAMLRRRHPGLEVETYFASVEAGRVKFEPLTAASAASRACG